MVHLDDYTNEVSDQFLSVTLDASAIVDNWKLLNFTSPRVINMAKALYPAMLRVGGTNGDFIIFGTDSEGHQCDDTTSTNKPPTECELQSQFSNFTMNVSQWDAVNEFVRAVGWDFIFGLDLLLRKPWPNGFWDSSNAEQLLTYTTSKGYNVNWELGNGMLTTVLYGSLRAMS